MTNKTTTETREALDKKCRFVKFGKDVIDHRSDGYMSAPAKTIYGFEYDDLMQLIQQEKQDLLEITEQTILKVRVAAHQLAINQRDIEAVKRIDSIIKEYEKLAEMSQMPKVLKVLKGKGEK